jgi:GT2 family glycosyltransferase
MIFVLPIFHNTKEAAEFIRSQLLTQDYKNIQIYVVVNGGNFYFEDDERVHILNPGKNLGYMGALRFVIETTNIKFDYITLANTDLPTNPS